MANTTILTPRTSLQIALDETISVQGKIAEDSGASLRNFDPPLVGCFSILIRMTPDQVVYPWGVSLLFLNSNGRVNIPESSFRLLEQADGGR